MGGLPKRRGPARRWARRLQALFDFLSCLFGACAGSDSDYVDAHTEGLGKSRTTEEEEVQEEGAHSTEETTTSEALPKEETEEGKQLGGDRVEFSTSPATQPLQEL